MYIIMHWDENLNRKKIWFKQGWFISTIVTLVNFFTAKRVEKRPIVAKMLENISKFNRRFKEREKK